MLCYSHCESEIAAHSLWDLFSGSVCGVGTEAVFTACRFSCSELLLSSLTVSELLCSVLYTARVGESQMDAELCGASPDLTEATGKLFLSSKHTASCKQILVFMH